MSLVTLIDGTEVDSASEDWRHECECRHILNLPTLLQRREWLYGHAEQYYGAMTYRGGLMQKRGPEAVKRIEATMTALWMARQKDPQE